ncbi:MAG: hypothetical protein F6J93_08155 [Oscillatoria sp. SIO1A7]|nr:hypothetical protein [Oscillatoria sp. SIO1A7]
MNGDDIGINAPHSQGTAGNVGEDLNQTFNNSNTIYNVFLNFGKEQDSELLAIQEILDQLDPDTINVPYYESLPEGVQGYSLASIKIKDVVRQLDELRVLDRFIEDLIYSDRVPKEVKRRLKPMLEHFKEEYFEPGRDSDRRFRAKKPHVTNNSKLESYLVIKIDKPQTPSISNKFLLTAWLISDDSIEDWNKKFQALHLKDTQDVNLCNLDEIAETVNKFIKKAEPC